MRLLLQRSLLIDDMTLERVMQAVLFYADTVTVRATATLPETSKVTYRRLNELIDMGAVRTWAHEYELARGGRIRVGDRRTVITRDPHHVIPMEITRTLRLRIDEELTENRDLPYSPGTGLREGVSEIVQLRHSMSTFRLADILDAGGLLAGGRERSPIIRSVERTTVPVDPREAVVREVVGRCSFGELSDLPLSAVEDCRRAMPRFSNLLAQRLSADGTSGHDLTPAELAGMIVAEYRKVRPPARPSRNSPVEGAAWDVVGAVLPHAVVVRTMGRQIEWFRYRGIARPFMLLGKLQQYTN